MPLDEPIYGHYGETFRLDWATADGKNCVTFRCVIGRSGTIVRAGIVDHRIMVPLFAKEEW